MCLLVYVHACVLVCAGMFTFVSCTKTKWRHLFPPLTLHTVLEEEILSGPTAYPQLRWKWASTKDIPVSAPKWHKSQRQAWDAQLTRVLSHELQSSWFQSKHLWPLNPLSPARFLKLISLIIEVIKIESSGKNNISDFHCILLKWPRVPLCKSSDVA